MDNDREKRVEFFIALRDKIDEISDLVDKYKYREKFVSAFIFGISQDIEEGDKQMNIQAITGMTVIDEDELDAVLAHLYNQYAPDEQDSTDINFWLNFGDPGQA